MSGAHSEKSASVSASSVPSRGQATRTPSRALVLGAFWAALTGAVGTFAGCYGHNCDGDTLSYGGNPGEGRLLDDDTWESSPIDGVWLPFPKQRFYNFDLRALGTDRTPAIVLPYVSAQADPLHEGGNSTIGAGNLAEISVTDKGRVTIHNGTCADYFLRLVVEAAPRPTGSIPATDAGDASVNSATGDSGAGNGNDDGGSDAGDSGDGN